MKSSVEIRTISTGTNKSTSLSQVNEEEDKNPSYKNLKRKEDNKMPAIFTSQAAVATSNVFLILGPALALLGFLRLFSSRRKITVKDYEKAESGRNLLIGGLAIVAAGIALKIAFALSG